MPATTSVKSSKIKVSASTWVFNIIGYIFITLIALLCLLPFIILISGSFSSEQAVRLNGLSIFPQEFTTEAYEFIFRNPQDILNAYGITILITAIGTGVGLIFLTMTAFVISRKDFKYRNVISFYFYFTTLFNGGMVCTYIFYIQYYGLKDNLLALILPGLTPVFYMLIMRNFVSGIPSALIESAKIDGAGEVRIFFQIVLPLLGSGLATIGLFMALTYWNDWYNAMLYINTEWKYPLQYMLYNMIQKAAAMARVASQLGIPVENMPTNTLKLAMAVVATGPIIQYYGLKDNLLALILPGLTPVFYMLIMRNFVSGIPSALIESAKIDGAGEVRIFFQIVLPLLGSGLATIGLFMALTYWNDWYNAMLYINTEWKYPLQYMLYNMIQKAAAMARVASQLGIPVENMPTNTLKLAMAVVATGPIILLYPFVQKYFVKGVTIGSVKG